MASNPPPPGNNGIPNPFNDPPRIQFQEPQFPPRNLPQAFGSTTTVNTIDNNSHYGTGPQHVDYEDEFDEEKPLTANQGFSGGAYPPPG